MPTLADRQKDAADALVTLIDTAWNPTSPDEVVREFFEESLLASLTGRKVFVFPLPDGAFQVQRENRKEVLNGHRIGIEIFEKYTSAGTPTKAWIDTRIEFVDTVYSAVDLILPTNRLLSSLWTEELVITGMADLRSLTENKLFFASIEGEFHEIVSG